MKKNNYILIALGLILFILIGIFSYNSYSSIKQKKLDFEQKKLEEQKLEEEIWDKIEDLEINPSISVNDNNSGSISVSDSTSNNDNKPSSFDKTKDEVTEQDLIKKESISILTFSTVGQCETLTYLKSDCEDKFLYSLAIEEWDLRYCNKLGWKTEINNCKDDINYKKNNCIAILNSYLKSKCEFNNQEQKQVQAEQSIISKSITSSDTSKCSTLETYYEKESCLKNVILNTNNIDLCLSFFKKPEEQTSCFKNVSYDFNRDIINEAFTKKDLSICEKIKDQMVKDQCKSMTF